MTNVAKLNYTADEINERLGKIDDIPNQVIGELEYYAIERVYSKNLFNKNKYSAINAYISTTDNKMVSNTAATTVYINVEPNTTYTVSKTVTSRFIIGVSNSDIVEIGTIFTDIEALYSASSLSITTGANSRTLAVFCYLSSADTLTLEEILDTLQIEKGGEATPYEPYQTSVYNAKDEIARKTANEAKQFASVVQSATTDKINTSSFYVKEMQDIVKDTEFISVINSGTFISQTANNEITNNVLYKNRPVITSTTYENDLTAEFRMVFSSDKYLNLIGTQEFDVIVYVPDVSKISKIEIRLSTYINSTQNVTLVKTTDELSNGWNYLRFSAINSNHTQWGSCTMLRILTYTTEATSVYYADVLQVKPRKARVLFVDDHAYSDFKTNAYPLLKAQGIPVTWAIQPNRLGITIENAGTLLSVNELSELANDPFSEFSFHSFAGQDTHSMSVYELQEDCQKCIYFLRKEGLLPKHYWRAAWKNNDAPNARECDSMLDGGAYHSSTGGLEIFPFTNKYNILRYSIHQRSTSDIDIIFDKLKKTHCVAVFYTHGYITLNNEETNSTIHISNHEFDYFIQKISQGVNEGWIEGTTFDRLMNMYSVIEF